MEEAEVPVTQFPPVAQATPVAHSPPSSPSSTGGNRPLRKKNKREASYAARHFADNIQFECSPPSSPVPNTPPSSPVQSSNPSSPLRDSEQLERRRTWTVYGPNRQPGRSTSFKLNQGRSTDQRVHPEDMPLERDPECSERENEELFNIYPSGTMGPHSPSGSSASELLTSERSESRSPEYQQCEGDQEPDERMMDALSDSDDSDSIISSDPATTSASDLTSDEEILSANLDNNEFDDEVWFDAETGDEISNASIQEEIICDKNIQLYDGSEFTVDEAILDMFENHLQNRESKISFENHVSTFIKYLPKSNNFPKSKYLLLKYVKDLAPLYEETVHHFCANCLVLLPADQNVCEICHSAEKKNFYGFSIEKQIRHYFQNCGLHKLVKQGQNVSDSITDICDGSEYKKIQSSHEFGLTLMMNTDGISVSHSSRTSLYPLLYLICEVPPKLRSSFMILCGVWCDSVKPVMNIFLRPFLDSLDAIHKAGGVRWTHPDSGVAVQSPVLAPVFCADAPVRAQLQNIMSHNGKYSCNSCEQKMARIPLTLEEVQSKAKGKNVRRKRGFLFKEEPSRLRTSKRMLRQAKRAFEQKKPVKGVKGPAVLSLLVYINLAACVFGEYMHLVCLGVVRRFMELWFNINEGRWYIGNHSDEISAFLKNISPPAFIGRLPRSISDLKYWKASEFRAFLLYYSLPVLKKFLPDIYFQHWMLFVMSIFILLQEKITSNEIVQAEIMLRMFVRDIGTLYRNVDYVYNVHELLHLPLYVKMWGPLWATSAFWFEKYNGVLCSFIHGTNNMGKELINNIKLAHGVEMLRQRVHLNKERTARQSQYEV